MNQRDAHQAIHAARPPAQPAGFASSLGAAPRECPVGR